MNRLGFRIAMVGAAAQAVGLGVDAWLHLKDPTLAAREALFTFHNLGHVLLIGGLALVIIGIAIATVGPRLTGRSRALRIGVPVVLASVMGVTSVAAANSGLAQPHSHVHLHGGGIVYPSERMDDGTRIALAKQLVETRRVAARYPTVADAIAAGYRQVTEYIPLIGAHFIRAISIDGTFDIEQPEMLLYDGTKPSSRIVGLSYYVRGKKEPAGFIGPNDHWHQHLGLCFDPKRGIVIGSEQVGIAECGKLGGVKVDGSDGWMVHAWVVPGWESPQGVFSAENDQLLAK